MADKQLPVGVRTCKTCRFNELSICKRFPPIVHLYPTDNQHPIMYVVGRSQPDVAENDWCGEHAQ